MNKYGHCKHKLKQSVHSSRYRATEKLASMEDGEVEALCYYGAWNESPDWSVYLALFVCPLKSRMVTPQMKTVSVTVILVAKQQWKRGAADACSEHQFRVPF